MDSPDQWTCPDCARSNADDELSCVCGYSRPEDPVASRRGAAAERPPSSVVADPLATYPWLDRSRTVLVVGAWLALIGGVFRVLLVTWTYLKLPAKPDPDFNAFMGAVVVAAIATVMSFVLMMGGAEAITLLCAVHRRTAALDERTRS